MKIIDFTTATTQQQRAECYACFNHHIRQVLRRMSAAMVARKKG